MKHLDLPCRKNGLVWIRWRDAVGNSTRTQVEDAAHAQLAINTNLGWILHENGDRLVLAHGVSSSGEVDHFVIPIACIVERRPVLPVRKTKQEKE
jgi:hypothetical protein